VAVEMRKIERGEKDEDDEEIAILRMSGIMIRGGGTMRRR